jgi:hypothetical protein
MHEPYKLNLLRRCILLLSKCCDELWSECRNKIPCSMHWYCNKVYTYGLSACNTMCGRLGIACGPHISHYLATGRRSRQRLRAQRRQSRGFSGDEATKCLLFVCRAVGLSHIICSRTSRLRLESFIRLHTYNCCHRCST